MARTNLSSVKQAKSRYTQGGETERFQNRLGWWERFPMPQRDDDLFITISAQYDKRPDRLAADYFGSSLLMWIVLQYNNIVDINEEFVSGKEIRLPEVTRALLEFTGKAVGGVTPSRE